jgi:hypothetical protein
MNKLTIPSVLIATVMIAAVFAFIPVDEAKAVHTTIQGTQFTLVDVISNASVATGITCDSDKDFIVKVIVGAAEIDGTTVTVVMNGETVTLTGDNAVAADAGAPGFGSSGLSFTIAAEADDSVVVDGTAAVDIHASMITESGATAACA